MVSLSVSSLALRLEVIFVEYDVIISGEEISALLVITGFSCVEFVSSGVLST